MKIFLAAAAVLAATFTQAADAEPQKDVVPQNYYGKVAQRLASMLPAKHVLQRSLDDEISQRAWTNLVTYYDFDRSVFLKDDLVRLSAHEKTIDDELKAGDVGFGFEVYRLYCERLRERIAFATNMLATAEWDFSSNETYRVKRKTAEWPSTKEDAEEHWRKRLKYELLAQKVFRELDAEEAEERKARKAAEKAAEKAEGEGEKSGDDAEKAEGGKPEGGAEKPEGEKEEGEKEEESDKDDADKDEPAEDEDGNDPTKTPAENLIKKYRQYVTVLTEPDEEAVMQHYMSAVCRAYDPHTDYLSPTSKEDFDMEMNLTLCGVGAVLSMDDGALKIAEVMPGGPMDVDGRIKEGDKIVGVGQGTNAVEDIMWQPMKKSIKKIRGPKDTRVTLEIIPRSDPTGTVRKRYELVRDEIKLEDQAATGRVETVTLGGFTNKVGYVYLPAFYGTMDKRPNDEGYRSCAMDIAKYISDFNAQDVEGLVLDLRGDGGGSLREAVVLSALFVPSGPVVQIRDTRSVTALPIPSGNPVAFKGPMVVLTDRASASASEIVAGHLKDTGRAIVLGDRSTHGKGTVQTVFGMGPDRYGSMKITTARFYRVDGRSTQLRGVESDIHLPSLLDSLDIGEDKLDNALPFTRMSKAPFSKCWNMDEYVPKLAELSAARLKGDERYEKHVANVAGMRAISERETVPISYDEYRAMAKADRSLRELDEDEDGEKKTSRRRARTNRRHKDDVVLDEALAIMSDLIRLNDGATLPKPPPTALDWYNAILGF